MKKIVLSSLLAIAAVPVISQAATGTITFTGNVTAQTCQVTGNTSAASDFTITMPNVSTSLLARDGQVASSNNNGIMLKLTGCSRKTASSDGAVRARFESGTNVDAATKRLKNTGTATNVQVGLVNPDGSDIQIGTSDQSAGNPWVNITGGSYNTATPAVDQNTGTATLQYGYKYVATGGAAGAGTVVSTVQYSIDFQ